MKKYALVVSGMVLAAAAAGIYFSLNETGKQEVGISTESKESFAKEGVLSSVQTAPKPTSARFVETRPTTPDDAAIQEKVWSIAVLPETSTMESHALVQKLEQMGFEFDVKNTDLQKFGNRTDYTMKSEKFGFVELSLSYDKAPQGERLLGLRATIPANQLEATKRILDAQKGDAKVSHQDSKFIRYERPDGYVLWIKVLDEETADGAKDLIGTVKIGLEPSQE
jgi:hypothetical protein